MEAAYTWYSILTMNNKRLIVLYDRVQYFITIKTQNDYGSVTDPNQRHRGHLRMLY